MSQHWDPEDFNWEGRAEEKQAPRKEERPGKDVLTAWGSRSSEFVVDMKRVYKGRPVKRVGPLSH